MLLGLLGLLGLLTAVYPTNSMSDGNTSKAVHTIPIYIYIRVILVVPSYRLNRLNSPHSLCGYCSRDSPNIPIRKGLRLVGASLSSYRRHALGYVTLIN